VNDSCTEIDEKIIDILKKYGEVKQGKYNLVLSYEKESVNVKIDISRNIRKNNEYEIKSLYGVDINTQAESTIFANKLVALTERNTNRDIYDVYFFLKK
jgi:predicted nucleotidyltransferase component of viral defense system